jgi:uncharacterized protein YjbJ (UPF0337 family)
MNSKSDQVKGHAKSVAGIVTGDKDLEAKGDAETRTANAAAHVDDAKDKAVELLDQIKGKLDDAAEKAKDALSKE